MTTRQFAESGITSRGPTAAEDSMVLTYLPIDTEFSGEPSTPVVVQDTNVDRIANASVERTWQLQASITCCGVQYNGLEAITPEIATIDGDGLTALVSEGIATFIAKSSMGNRTARLEHSITGGETFDQFNSWVSGSLAQDASDAVDDAIDGKVPATAMPVFTTQDHNDGPDGTYVRNTDCWAHTWVEGMTCISPWNSTSSRLRAGTVITPRHIIFANHYPIGEGATVRFVTSDNTVVKRTMTTRLQVGTTDFMIGLLDSDLPASITPCKLMADEVATKLPNLDKRIPILGLDQEEKALVSDWVFASMNNTMYTPLDSQRYAFNEPAIGGDSGNPSFAIINSALVMLTFYSSPGSGPATQYYLTEIQSTIDTLGAYGHTIDIVDLSSYPNY